MSSGRVGKTTRPKAGGEGEAAPHMQYTQGETREKGRKTEIRGGRKGERIKKTYLRVSTSVGNKRSWVSLEQAGKGWNQKKKKGGRKKEGNHELAFP